MSEELTIAELSDLRLLVASHLNRLGEKTAETKVSDLAGQLKILEYYEGLYRKLGILTRDPIIIPLIPV